MTQIDLPMVLDTDQRIAAAKRLARIVKRTRESFACEQFRRRRDAARKGWAMRFQRRSGLLRTGPEVPALREPAAIARGAA